MTNKDDEIFFDELPHCLLTIKIIIYITSGQDPRPKDHTPLQYLILTLFDIIRG